MKVYMVFQRFREDNEDIDSSYFNDEKGADLLKIFDDKQKADLYVEELFNDWDIDHKEENLENPREIWESDFNTFIKVEEVY